MTDTTTTDDTTPLATELTLQLLKPVVLGTGDKTITTTELRLTEPTMDQLRKSSRAGSELDGVAKLIEINANVLPAVVAGLGQRDVEAAMRFFGRFSSVST